MGDIEKERERECEAVFGWNEKKSDGGMRFFY